MKGNVAKTNTYEQVVKVIWHKAASPRTRTIQSYSPGGANVTPYVESQKMVAMATTLRTSKLDMYDFVR